LYKSGILLRGKLSHECRLNVNVRLNAIGRERVRNTKRSMLKMTNT
jgi:hypothetical protein